MNNSKKSATDLTLYNQFAEVVLQLVSSIPKSDENISEHPQKRAKDIAAIASLKASAVSGGLALPPGPLGMLTIIPDLIAVWKIQAQMVVDMAAAYGKTADLNREVMLYCLFKQAASQVFRDLVVRTGERFLIKRTSLRTIQTILQKIGVKVTQRVAGKGIARWLPIIGAMGVAAYAYYDTDSVAKSAIELFNGDITIDKTEVETD